MRLSDLRTMNWTLRPGRAVGLDIGSGAVKVMALQRSRDGLRIAGVGATPLNGGGPAQVAAAIHATLAKARVHGEPVVAAIGGPEVVIRHVSLPPLPRTRILPALEMQHREYGLLPPQEAVLDAQILRPSNGEPATETLAVSAPRALVEDRVRLLQSVGVRIKALDVEALALLNGILHLTELEAGELLVAVTIGRKRTILCLFSEAGPVMTRYLDVGAEDFTERIAVASDPSVHEDACRPLTTRIAEEVRLSVSFYRSEYDRDSLARYVLGGWMGLPQLAGWLEGQIGLGSPFELMDPFHAYESEGSGSMVEESPSGPEFLQAFGLALRGL